MATQTQQLKLLLQQEKKDLARIRAIQKRIVGEYNSETEENEFVLIEMEE